MHLFEISVPSDFCEAILLAVTPAKHCVGIKLFDDTCVTDHNANLDDDYEAFIDRCLRDAIDLKRVIESGMHDIENDPKIVGNPNSDHIDVEKTLVLRAKSKIRFLLRFFFVLASYFAMIISCYLFLMFSSNVAADDTKK